ncbi:SRPBCC family protein [Chloroflexota bacterium]
MPKFEITTHINQAPEVVHQAFIDPDNALQWTKDLVKFEVVSGNGEEAGAVAHLHYNQKGKSYIMEDVLEYCEPGRKYISCVSGGGLSARVETTIDPADSGTDITMIWAGTGQNLIIKVILWIMRRKIKRGAQEELDTFKNLTETHGSRFP